MVCKDIGADYSLNAEKAFFFFLTFHSNQPKAKKIISFNSCIKDPSYPKDDSGKIFLTCISADDIMVTDITAADIVKEGMIQVSGNQEWSVLTEAVYYILLSLYKPLHGYGIMQKVKELSNERVNLGPGTLYGAINTLLEKKWIRAVDGEKDSRKKEYEITSMGKEVVSMEIIRLEELISNGKKIIGG